MRSDKLIPLHVPQNGNYASIIAKLEHREGVPYTLVIRRWHGLLVLLGPGCFFPYYAVFYSMFAPTRHKQYVCGSGTLNCILHWISYVCKNKLKTYSCYRLAFAYIKNRRTAQKNVKTCRVSCRLRSDHLCKTFQFFLLTQSL